MRRFEFVEGSSSKFWQIALAGADFVVTWGKIGTAGQTQTKSWPSAEKAKAEHDKLVTEKTRKGYVEVGDAEADTAVAAPPPPAPKPSVKKVEVELSAAPASTDGWIDAGGGYALGIRDGAIVARNDKGKVLSTIPKNLKESPVVEQLEGALELLANHAVECRETVESWMLRSLPVPRAVTQAVWPDPAWRGPLENLVVAAGDTAGVLRSVEGRGVGVVTLDGETRWIDAASLEIPHPILLAELDDWRSLLAELGLAQGTAQLFRETFPKPTDVTKTSIDTSHPSGRPSAVLDFAGGEFDLLAQANNEAKKLGYRVSGGCAVSRVWEGGGLVEARFYLGDGDPMYEASTGDLSWVDARQRGLTLAEVGPVAFSEGMRMAAAIYAKRKIESKDDEDV